VTSSGHPSPRPLPGSRQQFLKLRNRAAVVALLLAVVAVGASASGRPLTQHGPWHDFGGPVAAVLEVVLVVLMLTLRSVRRRAPDASFMVARVRMFLHRTIVAAMIVVAWVVVSTLVWPGLRKFDANPVPTTFWPASGIPPRPFRQFTRAEADLIVAGLTLLVLAIITASVILLRRLPARSKASEPAADDDRSLQQAVDAGLRALYSADDARTAIIACYLSMEESLSAAGAARNRAETSAELLHRAVQAGLLHGPAADRLTLLFYEARYSTHELPAQARQDAMQALAAISADLTQGAGAVQRSDAAGAGAAP
jgi:Domain of unknown function (DUF4129)